LEQSIFHLTTRSAWTAARSSGQYSADSLASQGFIHCSSREQVVGVANALFGGQRGLVLLEIDRSRLDSAVRFEAGTDQPGQIFPHVYGPINLRAVVRVLDYAPGADGKFHPPSLREA
jgi:uncharacterized protein (DUF952 family)